MPANTQVRVISQNGTFPDCVAARSDDARKRIGHRLPLRVVEPDNRKIETSLSGAVEAPEFLARRLNAFASVMDSPEIGEFFLAQFRRSTSARIIGQPQAVSVQDVMAADGGSLVAARSTKRQAGGGVLNGLRVALVHATLNRLKHEAR